MSMKFVTGAALVASAFGLVGCASYPSTYGLDAGNANLVRQTCSEIMGLRTGPEAEACGGSLADTVRVMRDAHLTMQADDHCTQQGLTRGSAEQAKCVVMFRRSETERAAFASLSDAPVVPQAQPWTSYYSMNRSQQEERAELSCAQVGLHPATSGFWSCVTDLRHSIANIRPDTMP